MQFPNAIKVAASSALRLSVYICLSICLSMGLAASPSMGHAAEYDLPSAVEKALTHNPAITGAQSGVEAAEASRKSVRGGFGPSLDTSYSFYKYRNNTSQEYTLTYWEVELTQPIFTGFNLLSSYQKAALEEERQAALLDNTRLQLTLNVQEHFFLYLKARDDIRSAKDSVARLSEQLKITTAFYNVGLRPQLDVLQAQVDLSEAENQLIVAEHAEATQRAQLNTLLAIPVTEPTIFHGQLQVIPFHQSFEQCLEQAYRLRPDMLMAKKAVEMAAKDITIAESAYYPQVEATANWNTYAYDFNPSTPAGADSHTSGWEIGIGAEWNVFSWGSTYNDVQKNKHLLNQTKASEQALRNDVASEVKIRLLTLTEAAKRITVAESTLAQADEAYRMALARYQAQVGTNLDVLDAQAALTSAEALVTSAKALYLSALAYLNAATGRLLPDLVGSL
ncbi:MAG: TolC family protein [Pseudomonadota bacterium]